MTSLAAPLFSMLDNYTLLVDAQNIELSDPVAKQSLIWQLAAHCKESGFYIDIVPAMHSLTLFLTPDTNTHALTADLLDTWHTLEPQVRQGRLIDIPTLYGGLNGPDLDSVSELHGLTPNEIIERHSANEYTVMFMGFQPGFAYLNGLDSRLHTPRRSVPREKIARGSVAIGGDLTGIYPADSPGGWHIIGQTSAPLFDPSRGQPCLLSPGDIVRFVPVRGAQR